MGTQRDLLTRPSILRFANDSFMDDFVAMLERNPENIDDLVAHWETWREPMTPAKQLAEPIAVERPARRVLDFARLRLRKLRPAPLATTSQAANYRLKLYQPAHQRHYLITSSLVCGRPGFPDRKLDPGRHERVSFVVRRLFPKTGATTSDLPTLDPTNLADWEEHAFVQGDSGYSWRSVDASPTARAAGEEPLALFPVWFDDAQAHRRRVLAGVIPVGKREAYFGAPKDVPGSSSNSNADDARRALFMSQLIGPWKSLLGSNDAVQKRATEPDDLSDDDKAAFRAIRPKLLTDARNGAQTASWYLLLELTELFGRYLPNVLEALKTNDTSVLTPERRDQELALFNQLQGLALAGVETALENSIYTSNDVAKSLGEALQRLAKLDSNGRPYNIDRLESVQTSYDREKSDSKFPDFLFPFADPERDGLFPDLGATGEASDYPIEIKMRNLDKLADLIVAALAPSQGTEPAIPQNARPNIDPRDGWFVIRCVYERLDCGPLHAPCVSAPSAPFQLAAFFDPDAPARPIRIGLPIDPSPGGLRKFDKKAFIEISDMLCGHIDRVRQITLADIVLSVLPWPFHKDFTLEEKGPCKKEGLSLGMMCSLSLPIITLCAIILLIIMVSLLDLIFHWLPFFIVCFPIPGFKGKKGAAA